MSQEIIQSVAYDNYDDFQHVNFIFSQNFISKFWGLFNDQTDLRVRYYWLGSVGWFFTFMKNLWFKFFFNFKNDINIKYKVK
jgi:hypothetical protein